MGIQSSVNALMQQLYTIGAIGAGLREQKKQTKGQENTANEAKIQTEIAAGNAPMKDGKVDSEWLQSRRDTHFVSYFYPNGKLSIVGEAKARILENKVNRGIELDQESKDIYNNPKVQDYLKSFREKSSRLRSVINKLDSAIEAQSPNSELKNEVAGELARSSVKSRTASINKTKSNFDEHTASLIKYYSKGSGNP